MWQRLALVSVGGVLIGLLATAALLTPDRRGFGTHQQLGLPRCTVVELFGMRCPSCGMTTSWAYFMRGNWVQSARANSGGALLALVAAVVGPWMVISGGLGRWFVRPPGEWSVVAASVVIVVVTLADWCVRLFSS